MPLAMKAETLNMEWCLECHRNPAQFIRPRDQVFNVDWTPPADQAIQGARLVEEYQVRVSQLDQCSVCHL